MTSIVPFDFYGNQVRTFVGDDGEPWFIAKDVAEVLGYKNPKNAPRDHCKSLKTLKGLDLEPLGIEAPSPRGLGVIPERDVYRLIMRSHLPEAEKFEEWVVGEVLPTIRKTGAYQLQPKSQAEQLLEQAQALVEQERRIQAVEAKEKENEQRLDQIETGIDHFTVIGYVRACQGESLDLNRASKIGKKATKLCNDMGILMGSVPDPRFGQVNTYPKSVPQIRTPNPYPKSVLDEVFDKELH